MRFIVGMVTCLGLAALTPVFADPPAPAQSQASPAATATSSATAPATAQPAADAAKAAEVSAKERHFLSEGYKPKMHGGEKIFCKRQSVLGSRLETNEYCGTIDQLEAAERETRNDVEQAQRQQSNAGSH